MIELSFASTLWGFGFIGTVWALQFIGFPAVIFYRFAIAFVVGLFFLLLSRTSWKSLRYEARLAFFPGLFLSICLILQTWGLMTVSASKSSFITVMYVIIVPILEMLWKKHRLDPRHWVAVGTALIGVLLIVDIQWSAWTLGDSLTLGNAFFAAVHILAIGHFAKKSKNPFALNVFQSLWTALLALTVAFIDPRWNLLSMDSKGWIGIISLSIGSSLIAFYLQVRAQTRLSPSIASILFLMESPFTLIFAILLLGESLTLIQSLGAGLIFLSCLHAVYLQKKSPA